MPNSAVTPDPDRAPPDLKTINQERTTDYVAFVKYLAQSTGHLNYAQMAIIYPAICQAAMEWLMVEKKSVDFGFVIMHPMPHRANWKQIMLALFPTLGPTLLGKSRLVKEALLTSSGFSTKLLSGELLAVASERYVVWGIETELKRSWWKAMFRHEASKLSTLGSVAYASFTARQILKLKPQIIRAYLSFLRQVAYPCAQIRKSRVYSRGFIVPFVPKGRVRPVGDAHVPVHHVVPRAPEELAVPSVQDLAVTDAGLPPVPGVQSEVVDLRLLGGPEDTGNG